MSAKTSKRTSRRASHTPTVSTPPERPPSPLSPTRVSRTDEKRQLQNLNDRLSAYIEAIRSRESEIRCLKQERTTIEEVHMTEITQTKDMFNKEIAMLRKALDQTSKEKAKVDMLNEKACREAKEAKTEADARKRELDKVEKELTALKKSNADAVARMTAAEADVKTLRPENVKLVKKLEDAKQNLEDETLKRVDLQNTILSLEEQRKFENQMLEQQLNETRVRKQMEMSELDGRLNEDYERRYDDKLKELREAYEKQSAENQAVFAREYDDKIRKLQDRLDEERKNTAGNLQEMHDLEAKLSALATRNLEVEALNTSLQKRIADLKKDSDNQAAQFRAETARKDAEVRNKEEQMENLTKEYRDLMEIKVAFDAEIAIYRKLVEDEESRMGLSPTSSPQASAPTPTSGRGVKRKRTTYIEEEDVDTFEMVSDHEGAGNIVIETLTKDAKCVRIRNKSTEEINIGGWSLSNEANGKESTYKFHRSTVIKPDDVCTVWSSNAEEAHSPPLNIVMKKGGWIVGSENVTTLTNKEGEIESTRKTWEQKVQSGSFRSGMSTSSMRRAGMASEDSKSCAIM